MVAKNRRIRTAHLSGQTSAVAGGANETKLAAAIFVAQAKILIVGLELSQFIITTLDTTFDAGSSLGGEAELSRSGQMRAASVAITCGLVIGSFSMGSPASHGDLIDVKKTERFMFPEGYGIPMDEGEGLNMHLEFMNSSADEGQMYGRAIVYYIEE